MSDRQIHQLLPGTRQDRSPLVLPVAATRRDEVQPGQEPSSAQPATFEEPSSGSDTSDYNSQGADGTGRSVQTSRTISSTNAHHMHKPEPTQTAGPAAQGRFESLDAETGAVGDDVMAAAEGIADAFLNLDPEGMLASIKDGLGGASVGAEYMMGVAQAALDPRIGEQAGFSVVSHC